MKDENIDKIKKFICLGSEITGNLTSVAIGYLFPEVACSGALLNPVVKNLLIDYGNDFINRKLSNREQIRIGISFTYTTTKIQKFIQDGKELRKDDFFDCSGKYTSDAGEILEGVLLASQREHEEKKIIYYSNLLANIAFDENISKSFANNILRLAQQLSYIQLCLLKIYENTSLYQLKNEDFEEFFEQYGNLDVYQQTIQLNSLHLTNGNEYVIGLGCIVPEQIHLTQIGKCLVNMMSLSDIPSKDLEEVAKFLR